MTEVFTNVSSVTSGVTTSPRVHCCSQVPCDHHQDKDKNWVYVPQTWSSGPPCSFRCPCSSTPDSHERVRYQAELMKDLRTRTGTHGATERFTSISVLTKIEAHDCVRRPHIWKQSHTHTPSAAAGDVMMMSVRSADVCSSIRFIITLVSASC